MDRKDHPPGGGGNPARIPWLDPLAVPGTPALLGCFTSGSLSHR